MGIFSEQKPYTAVTTWVENLCSEQYDEEDYTGIPDLCDVARLQDTGFVPKRLNIDSYNFIDRQKPPGRFGRN
jgi:hypothetical protein